MTAPPLPEYPSPTPSEAAPPLAAAASEAPKVEEPKVEEPVEEPRGHEAPTTPDPRVALGGAGLVMIETDPSKSRPAPETAPAPRLGRPRRQRPPAQAGGELVQIETRK